MHPQKTFNAVEYTRVLLYSWLKRGFKANDVRKRIFLIIRYIVIVKVYDLNCFKGLVGLTVRVQRETFLKIHSQDARHPTSCVNKVQTTHQRCTWIYSSYRKKVQSESWDHMLIRHIVSCHIFHISVQSSICGPSSREQSDVIHSDFG